MWLLNPEFKSGAKRTIGEARVRTRSRKWDLVAQVWSRSKQIVIWSAMTVQCDFMEFWRNLMKFDNLALWHAPKWSVSPSSVCFMSCSSECVLISWMLPVFIQMRSLFFICLDTANVQQFPSISLPLIRRSLQSVERVDQNIQPSQLAAQPSQPSPASPAQPA